AFSSRERGQYRTHGARNSDYNLWSLWTDPSKLPTDTLNFNLGGENPKFTTARLSTDPGMSNLNFRHVIRAQNAPTATTDGDCSLGFLNHSYGPPMDSSDPRVAAASQYLGDPQLPFPWLAWGNRPYANIGELMMVPASSPAKLTFEFSMIPSGPVVDAYGNNIQTFGTVQQRVPFSHLLNFFRSNTPGSATTQTEPNLTAMLEYLQVPSPFVATETILGPTK